MDIVSDFKSVMTVLEKTVDLAGWDGTGSPEINEDRISFNGVQECGHKSDKTIGIAWPAKGASGVANTWTEDAKESSWFAGVQLAKRRCGGDCSHESFILDRVRELSDFDRKHAEGGKYFSFCKTAFKPYDIAVCAALIVAKNHLKDKIKVTSDGEMEMWKDGVEVCEKVLGYGRKFKFDGE